MQDMSKRANHELSEMSLVAMKPQTSKTVENNVSTTVNSKSNSDSNSNSNANRAKIFCKDCRFKHSPESKWYEQCKQHEDDRWIWCSTCTKHHRLSTRNAMPRKHLQQIQLHPEHRKPRLAHLIQLQAFQRVIRLHASVKWLSKPKCSKRSLLTVIQSCQTLLALIISTTASDGLLNSKTLTHCQLEQAMVEQEL